MEIDVVDNSDKILEEFRRATLRALARCGSEAHGYAVDLAPVDTGNLRNSIAMRVDQDEPAVYIGSNSKYAAYVELGTGKHYPGGRTTPWVYQDAKGNWHKTEGQEAQPYLKPAVADHAQTYKNIINDAFKSG